MSLQGITNITLTDSGDLYTEIPTITISPPNAAVMTATATALISAGNIHTINIDSGGSYYAQNIIPSVTIQGSATGTAVIINNRVSSITITDSGDGSYINPPVITIGGPTLLPSNFIATATATLDDTTSKIASVNITDSGDFYTSSPTITFSEPQVPSPYIVGEYVVQDSDTEGNVLTAEVVAYNDSDKKLSLIHIGSTNNNGSFQKPSAGKYLTGLTSNAKAKIVSSVIKETPDAQNLDFATEIEDFLDFSEGNPFGEVNTSTGFTS